MVFFVCEGCNESLKKNQVDTHANRCRTCHAVTCVDCNVTFPGDTYRSHTSCVTEAERYEKTVYRGVRKADADGGNVKGKKLNPQELWNAVIQEAAERKGEAEQIVRQYLEPLSNCENVPRKEKQFRNFTANSLKIRNNDALVGKIWEFLEKIRGEKRGEADTFAEEEAKKKEMVKRELKEKEEEEQRKREEEKKKSEPAKRKRGEEEEEEEVEEEEESDNDEEKSSKKDQKIVKKLLKKQAGNSMKLSELFAKFEEKKGVAPGFGKSEFAERLKMMKRIAVDGKLVSLKEKQ